MAKREIVEGQLDDGSPFRIVVDAGTSDEEIARLARSQVAAKADFGAPPSAVQGRNVPSAQGRSAPSAQGGAPAQDGYSGPLRDEDQEWSAGKPIETGAGTRLEGDIGFNQDAQPWTQLPEDFNEKYAAFARNAAAEGRLSADAIRAWAASNYPGLNISNADKIAEAFAKTNKLNTSGAILQKPAAIKPEGDLAPIAALGRGFGKTVSVGTLPALLGAYDIAQDPENWRRELDRQLAIQSGYEEEHPGWSLAGQMAGYIAPWARSGSARVAGAQGALMGGTTGFLESGGDPVAALSRAALEGTAGYGTERLARGATSWLRNRRPSAVTEVGPGARAYEAGQALGIDLPATYTSPTMASLADRGSITSAPVLKGETTAVRATGERLGELADTYLAPGSIAATGTPADIKVSMGESLVGGTSRWLKNISKEAGDLYSEAGRLSQGAIIPPHETRAVLSQELQNLSQLPNMNSGQIAVVRDVLGDLVQSPGGVQSLRDIRTALWNRLSASDVALTTSQKGALVSRISGALSRDIENGLTNLAKTTNDPRFAEALGTYKKANALWQERSSAVKNVLGKILGKDDPNELIYGASDVWETNVSPQQAAEVLQRFTRKDHGDLVRTINLLDDTSKGDVKASLINMLGAGKNGDFDPAAFARNYDAVPSKTREALFGVDGAKALDSFRDIADVMVNPLQGRGSRSSVIRTAKFLELLGLGGATTAGALEGGLTGAGLAAAGAGTLFGGVNYGAARILASPQLSRMVYLLSKATDPQNRYNIIQNLGKFAARNPEYRETVADIAQRAMGVEKIEGPLVGREKKEELSVAPDEEVEALKAEIAPADGLGFSSTGTEESGTVLLPDGTEVPAYIGAQYEGE